MKKLRFLIILSILLPLILTACGTHRTANSLRQNPAATITFEVNEPYDTVYRKIYIKITDCRPGESIGNIFPDIESAQVVRGFFGDYPVYSIVIDIKKLSDQITEVSIKYSNKNWRPDAAAIEKWLKEGYTECKYPTRKAPQTL